VAYVGRFPTPTPGSCAVRQTLCSEPAGVAACQALGDEVFARSIAGRRYTALYEKHASEAALLLATDPELAAQAAAPLVVAVLCVGAALPSGGGAEATEGPLPVAAAVPVQPQQQPGGEYLTRTITYTYDPLNRLTGADYSTGESFEYQYDAVGNRTAMTDTTGVTTYEYDAANRLTSANGVTYTWDDRGNLTNDGVFTYTYNAAGRMVRAESVTVTLVYTYTAAGLRVAQSVDGDVTNFAWDWASGLPEMLREGGNLYLVGQETLGQFASGEWAYYLPDALGSVRQVVDGAGAVVSAREWTPYGVEMGAAQAGLGYTGEWFDGGVGLEYLRARWYDGRVGRFTRRDPWRGSIQQPQIMLSGYVYVGNRPINTMDPSGLFPLPYGIPAGQAVLLSKWLYSQSGLLRDCFTEADDGQWPSDTVDDLLTDYVCEYGPEHRYFFADAHLTHQLAKSIIIHRLREQIYWEGTNPLEGTYYSPFA